MERETSNRRFSASASDQVSSIATQGNVFEQMFAREKQLDVT